MRELFGLEVRESVHAVTLEQARIHVQRRGQSNNYHRRIMKKWRKRFGTRAVPCMYKIGAQITRGREVLVVHPDLMPKLVAAAAVQSKCSGVTP